MDRDALVEKMAERLVLRRFPKVENIVRWKRNNKIEWGEIWEDARAALTEAEPVVREWCAADAGSADLPDGFQWGATAREGFDFGKERAVLAIRTGGTP